MSAHDKSNSSANVPVVGVGRSGLKLANPRYFLYALGLLLLALVVGILVLVVHRHGVSPQASKQAAVIPLTTEEKADQLSSKGGYSQGQALLHSELSSAATPAAKAMIYMQQTTLALNNKQYTDATQYAQSAESLLHSASTAELEGQVAAAAGDKKAAASYFNVAISRVTTSPISQVEVQQYQNELNSLGM